MDEQTIATPKTTAPPPTGRFMDIQKPAGRPGQADATQPADEPATTLEPTAEPTPANIAITSPSEPTEPVPTPEVAEPTHDEPVVTETGEPVNIQVNESAQEEPAAAQFAETTPAPADPTPPSGDSSLPPLPDMPQKSSGAPVVAVFIAIIVSIALIGLVVFIFIQSKNDSSLNRADDTTSSSNSKTTVPKPQASPEDVDQTSNDIDETLGSIDDAADFSASALSDEALGL